MYSHNCIDSSKFTDGKTITFNTIIYPITLSDVKLISKWYLDNPTDTTQDLFVSDQLIKNVINSWENETKFYILDQTRQAFLQDNIATINKDSFTMDINALNISSVINVKYYPYGWNYEPKTILDSTKYYINIETLKKPSLINLKKEYLPFDFHQIAKNIEINYQAGYVSNIFTSMPIEIKDCLTQMTANAIDVKKGYCDDYWKGTILEVVNKYKIINDIFLTI